MRKTFNPAAALCLPDGPLRTSGTSVEDWRCGEVGDPGSNGGVDSFIPFGSDVRVEVESGIVGRAVGGLKSMPGIAEIDILDSLVLGKFAPAEQVSGVEVCRAVDVDGKLFRTGRFGSAC